MRQRSVLIYLNKICTLAGAYFLTTFEDNGTINNSTFFGSNNDEYGEALATNHNGNNIFFAGGTSSYSNFPFLTNQSSLLFEYNLFSDDKIFLPQTQDGFLSGFNSSFTNKWTTYIGGTGDPVGYDFLKSAKCYDNYLYLVGYTFSTYDFPYVDRGNAYNGSGLGGAIIMRFELEGTPLYVPENFKFKDQMYIFYPNTVKENLTLEIDEPINM